MPRGSVLIDEGSGQFPVIRTLAGLDIARVWMQEGTIFRRNHPSLVNLLCWDEVVLIRALLECWVSKRTRGHTRRIEQKWSHPKSPFFRSSEWSEALVWKKWEKIKKKNKKRTHWKPIWYDGSQYTVTLHFQDWRGALSNIRSLRGYRKPRRNHRSHMRKLSLYVISGVLKWIWDTV